MITLADIAGNGAAKQVTTPSIAARQVYVSATGSGAVRFGDANVSATQGIAIIIGAQPVVLEAIVDAQGNICPYSLNSMYFFASNSASLQIAYEPF